MSVLIEALTLVVPKKVLDVSYPGGSDAFCSQLLQLDTPPRFICNGDPNLVNASFYDANHMEPATDLLVKHGVVAIDDNKFLEFAVLDQRFGPTLPCEWLEWRRAKQGFTCAWHVGLPAGEMAAPEGWTPKQSRDLTREDVRDDKESMFHLATEGKVETWLDLKSGRIIRGLADSASNPTETIPESPSDPFVHGTASLFETVQAALNRCELISNTVGPTTLVFRTRESRGTYDVVMSTEEQTRLVCCSMSFPERVPALRRGAVAEAMARANWDIIIGNFELDFSDGEMRFRQTVDVEGGQLAEKMVFNMVSSSTHLCERYHNALMRIAFGDGDPELEIASVTSG